MAESALENISIEDLNTPLETPWGEYRVTDCPKAPGDLEQIESICDYLEGKEGLRFENWQQLSPEERLNVLTETENDLALIEHRVPCTLQVVDLGEGCHGCYDSSDKSITISLSDISGSSFDSYKETLDTLIHEARHAYQDYNLTVAEVHPRKGEIANWDWNENKLGYQSPQLCGFEAYAMQPVEADARAFAADVIDRYLNKTA